MALVGGDGGGVAVQDVIGGHASQQEARQILVNDVVHVIAGPDHGRVHQLGVGLGVVNVLDHKVEVLGLVDNQVLLGAVQLLGIGDVAAGVVVDGDLPSRLMWTVSP